MKKMFTLLTMFVLTVMFANTAEAVSYKQFQEERFSAGIETFSCYSSRDGRNIAAVEGHRLNADFVVCTEEAYHPLNKGRRNAFDNTIAFLLDFFGR